MNTQNPEVADQILKPLACAVFFIFFNGYMIAPLIPVLAGEFRVTPEHMGYVIPAYMLTYGFSVLFYGPLSDRVGRKKVLLIFLALTIFATALGALAWSAESLIALRIACGICAGGVLPISLALIGDLYPYERVGRPMGWMFGAVAGGMSFGSTVGAWLNPLLGWRNELFLLSGANTVVFYFLWRQRHNVPENKKITLAPGEIVKNYATLLSSARGSRLYALIFLNGAFHSGIFSWLGLYLIQRYQLSEAAIGTALLGYGLPGMFLGPVFGKLADKYGRHRIIPFGYLVASLSAYLLIPQSPLWAVALVFTTLSVGFDMTHPLMSGVVTRLDPERRGQAMGLNAFALFTGLGFGALAFQLLMAQGMWLPLSLFGTVQAILALASARFFGEEASLART